jgi:hypothetical protein
MMRKLGFLFGLRFIETIRSCELTEYLFVKY